MKIKILKDNIAGKAGDIVDASFPGGDAQEYVDNGHIEIIGDGEKISKTIIPEQLHNPAFRFCLITPKTKIPFEKGWQKNGYKFDDPKLLKHISQGGNFGVIGGYGKLIIIDIDDPELGEELEKQFDTFTVRTGGGGRHFYFIEDEE